MTADQWPELGAFERSREKRRGVRQASADLEEALARPASQDAAGNLSTASTSTDNTIDFNDIAPTVTINQGSGQVDPTSIASVVFDIHFSKPMSGFTPSDVPATSVPGRPVPTRVYVLAASGCRLLVFQSYAP